LHLLSDFIHQITNEIPSVLGAHAPCDGREHRATKHEPHQQRIKEKLASDIAPEVMTFVMTGSTFMSPPPGQKSQ